MTGTSLEAARFAVGGTPSLALHRMTSGKKHENNSKKGQNIDQPPRVVFEGTFLTKRTRTATIFGAPPPPPPPPPHFETYAREVRRQTNPNWSVVHVGGTSGAQEAGEPQLFDALLSLLSFFWFDPQPFLEK